MLQRLFTIFLIGPLLASGFVTFACCRGEASSCCCRAEVQAAACPCSANLPADSSSSDECRCAAKAKPWLPQRMQLDERPAASLLDGPSVALVNEKLAVANLPSTAIDRFGGSTPQQLFCLWLE